jgi:hypothetical protein
MCAKRVRAGIIVCSQKWLSQESFSLVPFPSPPSPHHPVDQAQGSFACGCY